MLIQNHKEHLQKASASGWRKMHSEVTLLEAILREAMILGRQWGHDEEVLLKENYRAKGAAWCVGKLQNRSYRNVYQKAKRLGLTHPIVAHTDEDLAAFVIQYHAEGLTDAEIKRQLDEATRIRVDRHRIGVIRRRMGLPTNITSQHARQRVASKTKEQVMAAGAESLAQIRAMRWKKWKQDLGWPDYLTVRSVQALELFWRHGPLTRIQLCELLGVNPKIKTNPKSNAKGGTVLAELVAADLIGILRKSVPIKSNGDTKRRVKYCNLYFLNPGVKPNGKT